MNFNSDHGRSAGIAGKSSVLAAMLAAATGASVAGAAEIAVSNVSMVQDRATQKVTVTYDLANEGDAPAYVVLDIQTNGVSIGRSAVKSVTGDVSDASFSRSVSPGTGKTIVWDARHDWKGNVSDAATAVVHAYYAGELWQIPEVYMKVDLSGGSSAASYPVSYSLEGPDPADPALSFAKDTLWLRRIEPGVFKMGSPVSEKGHDESGKETLHQVTLTKPFFIAVFEFTQYQWRMLTGTTLSPGAGKADEFPASHTGVSFNTIRGAGAVDAAPADGSVLAILRSRTSIAFDLPTEAQWEYACRAGTETAFYNGTNPTATTGADANLSLLAWYAGNYSANQFHQGGLKLPNAWGLYDMLGNAFELVRDRYLADLGTVSYNLDPLVTSGTQAILRGGSVDTNVNWNRAAWRLGWNAGNTHRAVGFRVSWTVGE